MFIHADWLEKEWK